MCLAIPGKVVKVEENKIAIDYSGELREANFSLMDVDIGDYVIVSNKIIIEKLDEERARKFLEVVNEE